MMSAYSIRAANGFTLNPTCIGSQISLFSLYLMEKIMAFSFIWRRNCSKPQDQEGLPYIGFIF